MEEQDKKLNLHEKQIENAAAVIAEALDNPRDKHIPIVALPNTFDVASLEHYLPSPIRFRGRFQTSSLSQFVKYIERHKENDTLVFIDDTGGSARSIIDLGTPEKPGNFKHIVNLQLKETAPFKALKAIEGRDLNQKDWAEWIEDMRSYLTIPEDPSGGSIAALVSKVRSVTIDQKRESSSDVGDYSAARSEIETIDAKSKNGELPSRIVFTCSPYHELPEQRYVLRMSMLTGGSAVRFKVSVICMEDHEEETTKNFENELTKAMPESVGIFIGHFNAGS